MYDVIDARGMINRRRPLFQISFDDYIGTINGFFNFLELCGGCVLYIMLGTAETTSQSFLGGTAYTYSFNGLLVIFSSFVSATSAFYLTGTFYYVLFHGTGALMYICTCIIIIRDSKEVGGPPMVGLMTGGLHSFHCAYATYKNYYEKR